VSEEREQKEPLILWWMPVVALLAPLVYAAWKATDENFSSGLEAFFLPGVGFYVLALAVLWGGWKIELE